MRKITSLTIHQSDSDFGDQAEIDRWHRKRGWNGTGYHYVLLNGYRKWGKYIAADEGFIQPGRPVEAKGAHCPEVNGSSVAICCIGKGKDYLTPTLRAALLRWCVAMCKRYGLTAAQVRGHYEYPSAQRKGKTCPGIDMDALREELSVRLIEVQEETQEEIQRLCHRIQVAGRDTAPDGND